MKLEDKEYLNYSDVLIKPQKSIITSRKNVELTREIKGLHGYGFTSVPILVSNMDGIATFRIAKIVQTYGLKVCLSKYYTATEIIEQYKMGLDLNHFVSIGMSESDIDKLEVIWHAGYVPPILIDVANGYMDKFLIYVSRIRKIFPNAFIAAGNVATPDILKAYKDAGADAVRIGIGPGGQCRTRVTAGVGIPQFTAVADCAKKAKKLGLLTIADGGVNEYCDFAKAFGAGADMACAGSMFAGHLECDGEITTENGKRYIEFYGMSSDRAMDIHGTSKSYRSSEGRVTRIEIRGSICETLETILGAIRSTMTYTNTYNIENLNKVTFIKVRETINNKYEKYTTGY